ncbi:hypothetical protein A2U01_0055282, partial [Trifolium medium]|nr:hypothetical protein [Trifolium medium]
RERGEGHFVRLKEKGGGCGCHRRGRRLGGGGGAVAGLATEKVRR